MYCTQGIHTIYCQKKQKHPDFYRKYYLYHNVRTGDDTCRTRTLVLNIVVWCTSLGLDGLDPPHIVHNDSDTQLESKQYERNRIFVTIDPILTSLFYFIL